MNQAEERMWIRAAEDKCSFLTSAIKLLEEAEAELKQLRESQRWIPVSERLPEDEEVGYLIVAPEGGGEPIVSICFCSDVLWTGLEVTHWMPLPPPPEPENKSNE